jgi:SpoVK/Ycf46/Vps4 family AAA+-type ATPase
MAENDRDVFVVATANDITELPPELVRKGRFDEIFLVDLPGPEIRESILDIHLNNRGQSAGAFDLATLSAAMDGFSGAEIEQAIVSALYAAHANRMPLSDQLILSEVEKTQPLSVVMAERIGVLRQWASGRTAACD